MYEYKCTITRIVDGDTVDVDIDLGFGVWLKDERVRIMGIDTPESRTADPVEKVFGLASKKRLQELLGETGILKTVIDKDGSDAKGKFGRILGEIFCDGDNINVAMCEASHAVEYYGQSKDDIQQAHLKNRKILLG